APVNTRTRHEPPEPGSPRPSPHAASDAASGVARPAPNAASRVRRRTPKEDPKEDPEEDSEDGPEDDRRKGRREGWCTIETASNSKGVDPEAPAGFGRGMTGARGFSGIPGNPQSGRSRGVGIRAVVDHAGQYLVGA